MRKLLFLSLALLLSGPAFATPGQVLIIRHGEKISDEHPDLSPRGQRRAQALVDYFLHNPAVNFLGRPVGVYAAAPKHSDGSIRPYQTIQPLARALRMSVNLEFDKDDERALVDEVMHEPSYDGKTVVISWVHKEIPALAKEFGAKRVPDEWTKGAFDRVWQIPFEDGRAGRLVDLPQHLLPGDSAQ